MDSGSGKQHDVLQESMNEEEKRIAALSCADGGCGNGHLDPKNAVWLQTGCSSLSRYPAYPCDACGRLHWDCGNPVFNRRGMAAFLENGEVVQRGEEPVDR